MEFKIDTKATYTVITPETELLSANLAGNIRQKVEELEVLGSHNFLINLEYCSGMETAAGNILQDLHQYIYNQEASIVFTSLRENVLQVMKQEQLHLSLNLTPSMIEGVDIISMEVLERDLLKEP